jgi:cytochrome b561
MILVGGHTLAALGHHYLLKDGVLRRMPPLHN